VAIGLEFRQLTMGSSHTCGIDFAGAAYCWGANNFAQLGNGSTTDAPGPVAVSGGLAFVQISAGGGEHTCALDSAGSAYCWGDNSFAQLGDGGTTQASSPVAVSGALSFVQITAGVSHTCGLDAAGRAFCWGRNFDGRLGDGTTTPATNPVPVAGGITFLELSAGLRHTCGRDTSGTTYCWGNNPEGQLGNPAVIQTSVPVPTEPYGG
jgi:alpha-tubulin suppressor-like RCC1 family protein